MEKINIAPKGNERAGLFGQTGCGKTTLAKALTRSRNNLIVLDTKGFIFWNDCQRFTELEQVINSKPINGIHRVV